MWRRAAVAAAWLVGSGPALAGPLVIAPTTIQFAPERRSAVIEVTNPSAESVDLQFRAFAWTQVDGRDMLEPTGDLAVSPAIARLPPGGRQLFRVLDTGPRSTGAERSYRLKLNELPRAAASTIAINVEFSLPVFLTPRAAAAHLAATLHDGVVEIVNRGDRRVRVSALAVRDPDGRRHDLAEARSSYLLAGSTRRLAIGKNARIGDGATLTGTGDTGAIDEPLATLAAR